MNTHRYLHSVSRKVFILAIAAMVAFGSVFSLPARVALAEPPDPQPYVNANSLARAQKWLSQQQANVVKGNAMVLEYQDFFTEAESQSIDTASISSALATFQSQLEAANPILSSAADILATHNGFGDNGNVTDKIAATQTINSANQALGDARSLLVHAGKDFTTALNSWEKANPIVKQIEKLQVTYQKDQTWLDDQQTNLGKAATVVTNIQNLITEAKSKGLSHVTLSNVLTDFKAKVKIAQSYHDIAAEALATHAGFDASGNVTDVNAASQTVLDAGQNLMFAFSPLRRTSAAMLRALDTWQVNQNIKTKSTIYPTFKLARDSANNLNNSVRKENTTTILSLDTRLANLLQAFAK